MKFIKFSLNKANVCPVCGDFDSLIWYNDTEGYCPECCSNISSKGM